MNVRNMPQDEGMLFVFKTSGIYSFWMKDTLIPLDIIWLNKDGEVVFIKHEAKPCSNIVEAVCKSIVPNKMAKYVIELNAGVVDEIGLIKKDKIDIDSILN